MFFLKDRTMSIRNTIRTTLAVLAAGALLASPLNAADDTPIQDNLDEMLRGKAPELIKYLRSKNHTNVGVVKFLVKKGDAAPTDNAGELNLGLANRLQVALVLNNPDEDLGIIQQASRTITKENNVRANHLSKEGRKAFFNTEYDLAWGPRKVTASAFLTGLATISKDLKKTTIRFQIFDKDGEISDVLNEVVMETSPRILTEAGYSYLINPDQHKDAFASAKKDKGNRFPRATIVEKAAEQEVSFALAINVTPPPVQITGEPNPFKEGPVKLTVLYNGVPQSVVRGKVPEPKETDKVTFQLENPTADTYAVLLKVNGVNTLFGETIADPKSCLKWVLHPGAKQTITGFQVNDDKAAEFKVLSPQESAENEVNYGSHAGTFRMATFKGSIVKEDPTIEPNRGREENELARAAIARGTLDLSDIQAGSLNALQRTLRGREKSGEGARGLIIQGKATEKREVERAFFKYDYADPVHDVTLRYYEPTK